MTGAQTVEASNEAKEHSSGFLTQICAYFRDFLDSDFRRQRLPKRSIEFKDQRNNLTGVSIGKYPSLVADIWEAFGKRIGPAGRLSIGIPRGRYRSRIRANLLEVIEKHVATLSGDTLAIMADRVKANARELLQSLRNDPERYQSAVIQSLRSDFIRTAVGPLLVKLDAFFESHTADAFETAYNIEDELSDRLIADAQAAICSALATAIVDNR